MGTFINRDEWAFIYDIARANGMSPFRFLTEVSDWAYENLSPLDPITNERGFLEACKLYSLRRSV